jgi:hypothetical protein
MHTLLDLHGSIPSVILITHGKVHDLYLLHQLVFEPGAFYVMDRGYLDFERLYKIHQASAFFVIRAKSHVVFKRLCSMKVDKSTGVRSDQIIAFSGFYAHKDYPDKLRRVSYRDAENNKRLHFLYQQFHTVGLHHRPDLSLPMAGRTLLRCSDTMHLFVCQ